jgi:hypothetical protein
MWIHHWIILQFVHPHFSVGIKQKLDEKNPDGTSVFQFKVLAIWHGNGFV